MKTKEKKAPKSDGSWLTIRDAGLKMRLDKWAEKFRRPNRSDAARMILEDRLTADGIK